jgi:hypothetical protein
MAGGPGMTGQAGGVREGAGDGFIRVRLLVRPLG